LQKQIPAGKHQVRMEFAYDGGGMGKGGTVSLYIYGEKTGEGSLDRTTPNLFSLDDKANVGADRGTPVSNIYVCAASEFNGQVKWVQIDLADSICQPCVCSDTYTAHAVRLHSLYHCATVIALVRHGLFDPGPCSALTRRPPRAQESVW
jgi:hypothetical protein